MTEYPFGAIRRVRYQDGAGDIKTVRARLLQPDPQKHPEAAVVLEISQSEQAYLPLQAWQVLGHEPAPRHLKPVSPPRK